MYLLAIRYLIIKLSQLPNRFKFNSQMTNNSASETLCYFPQKAFTHIYSSKGLILYCSITKGHDGNSSQDRKTALLLIIVIYSMQ